MIPILIQSIKYPKLQYEKTAKDLKKMNREKV